MKRHKHASMVDPIQHGVHPSSNCKHHKLTCFPNRRPVASLPRSNRWNRKLLLRYSSLSSYFLLRSLRDNKLLGLQPRMIGKKGKINGVVRERWLEQAVTVNWKPHRRSFKSNFKKLQVCGRRYLYASFCHGWCQEAPKLNNLDRHSLALVHVQVPVERKVEQPQLCESFLPQCFRLRHRWHTRMNVHDRSGARQSALASRRVSTGSRMTSARDGTTRKTWFIVWKCASSVPTHPSLFARLFLLRRPTCGCTWTCCLGTGTFSIASEFCTFKKRFTFSIAITYRRISYFFTQEFSHSPGRNWRKWITKIGKQLSLKLNEQQSENFSSSFLMDLVENFMFGYNFGDLSIFFSFSRDNKVTLSVFFCYSLGKTIFRRRYFVVSFRAALTQARDTPARERNFRRWVVFTMKIFSQYENENVSLQTS